MTTDYPKLLCVDDSQLVQSLIARELDTYEVDLHFANNGSDGLDWCLREMPNLVMLDIKMPTMDGIEFLKKWRTELGFVDTRFMIMTSETSREIVETVLKLGISDYLAKPFSGQTMVKRISRHIPLNKKERHQAVSHTPRLFLTPGYASTGNSAVASPAATSKGKANLKTIKVMARSTEEGMLETPDEEYSLHDILFKYQTLLSPQSSYLTSIIAQILKDGKVTVVNGNITEKIKLKNPHIKISSETVACLLSQFFEEQRIDSEASAAATQRIVLHRSKVRTRPSS